MGHLYLCPQPHHLILLTQYLFNPNVSWNSRPFASDNDKLMIKAKIFKYQFKNMVIIVIHFSTTFDIRNTFLASKVEINNHRLNKVKINNLKTSKDLGVIIEDKIKLRIRSILDL
jgi:hypothetical protein